MALILLVDADPQALAALRRELRPLRCEVEVFMDARAALVRAAETPFDLVICDYRLPGTDGLSLLKELRRHQQTLVAILLSSYVDLRWVLAATREGEIFRHFTKPWDGERLRAAVTEVLAHAANLRKQSEATPPQGPRAAAVARPQGAMAMLEERYPGITQPGPGWESGSPPDQRSGK